MGTRRLQFVLWFLCLMLLDSSLTQTVTIVSSLNTLSQSSENASHISQVCTTWGYYHWKTFDGDFFQLPSTCNHVLVSQCGSDVSFEDFNIQMRRKIVDDFPTIDKIIMRVGGSVVEVSSSAIVLNDKTVSLPLVTFGITVKGTPSSIIIEARLGIKVIWNLDDALDV